MDPIDKQFLHECPPFSATENKSPLQEPGGGGMKSVPNKRLKIFHYDRHGCVIYVDSGKSGASR